MGSIHEVLNTVPDTYVSTIIITMVITIVIPIITTTTKATVPIYNVPGWMLGTVVPSPYRSPPITL